MKLQEGEGEWRRLRGRGESAKSQSVHQNLTKFLNEQQTMASSDICGEGNGSIIEPPMMKSGPQAP